MCEKCDTHMDYWIARVANSSIPDAVKLAETAGEDMCIHGQIVLLQKAVEVTGKEPGTII